jgi:hypothetical protein
VKAQSPLLGYNNNVSYKGCVYHVQTEDSGSRRPHVVTHLFAEGGRVVKSSKTSYEQLVGVSDQNEQVRGLMKQQHKAMLVALREGFFDQLLGLEMPPSSSQPASSSGGESVDEAEAPGQRPSVGPDSGSEGEASQPVVPVDVLERAAAAAERDFFREIQVLSTAKSGVDSNAGAADPSHPPSYRYVDAAYRAKTKAAGDATSKRVRSTGTSANEPAPASVAQAAADEELEVIDRETIPVPPPDEPSNHVATHRRFGDAFITDRRLDEVMAEFLTNRFEARG